MARDGVRSGVFVQVVEVGVGAWPFIHEEGKSPILGAGFAWKAEWLEEGRSEGAAGAHAGEGGDSLQVIGVSSELFDVARGGDKGAGNQVGKRSKLGREVAPNFVQVGRDAVGELSCDGERLEEEEVDGKD
jgi:hypothetical protein